MTTIVMNHSARAPQDIASAVLRPTPWALLAAALGFGLWLAWCTLVARLPALGFRFTANQLYWLVALPALAMACTRVVAALLPRVVAGSEWTAWISAGLLPLAAAIGTAAQQPETPFELMVVLALLCGSGVALFVAALSPAAPPLQDQAAVLQHPAAAWLGWPMVAGLGSLVGLTAALPLVAAPAASPALIWLAPLLGIAMVPLGDRIARQLGAARSTLWALVALTLGVLAWGSAEARATPQGALHHGLALAGPLLMFSAAGSACGSSLRMVAQRFAGPRAAAALGLATTLGSFGGFVLPKALGSALALSGSVTPALALFFAFYLACALVTWWQFARRHAPFPCQRTKDSSP
jgi:MFS transporter, NNP family, nitrate/nitrite transporter